MKDMLLPLNVKKEDLRRQTFQQFAGRDRGISQRLSVAVRKDNNGEFGALEHSEAELTEIFGEEKRRKQIRWYLAWGLVNLIIMTYVFVLVFVFWDTAAWTVPCVKRLNVWLLIYLFV